MADQFSPNIYSKFLWNLFNPGFANVGGQFNAMSGTPGYGMPQAPTMPSMSGVLTGAGSYGIPSYNIPSYGISGYDVPSYGISGYNVPTYETYGYNVPSTSSIMPTTDWWKGLSPQVKEGAWQPFAEGQKSLMETLGGSGQGGSARGGYSGATGAALGQYMADATPAYATSLWNMTAPGAMAGWQANLGQNQYLANLQNQKAQWGAQAQLGANQYLAGLQNQQAQWGAQAQLGANQYLAGLQNQQAQWGAQAQLGANQYLAGLGNEREQWLAQQGLGREQWLAQQQLAQNQLGYQNALTERQTNYQNILNQLQQNYQGSMGAWQMPWQMAMNYNNLAPSGAYHSDGGGTLSSIMGAGTSILGPLAMGYGMSGMGGKGGSSGSKIMPYIPAR